MLTGSQDIKTVQASSAIGEGKLFDFLVRNPHEFNPSISKIAWDFDWDKRDPASLVPPTKSPLQTEEEIKRQNKHLSEARPTATRHLLLIRHGQYNLKGITDEEKALTTLVRHPSLHLPSLRVIWNSNKIFLIPSNFSIGLGTSRIYRSKTQGS